MDAEAALSVLGVVRVHLADGRETAPMPLGAPELGEITCWPVVASERVRFAGDIIAVVVPDSEQIAGDAADLLWPEIEPLPTVSITQAGTKPDAPLLFPELGTNVIYERGATLDDVLSSAEVTIEFRVVNQCLAAVPLETSGVLVVTRPDGGLNAWIGSQPAHSYQSGRANILRLDPSLIHIKVPDVGGGFGAKTTLYPEQLILYPSHDHHLS